MARRKGGRGKHTAALGAKGSTRVGHPGMSNTGGRHPGRAAHRRGKRK